MFKKLIRKHFVIKGIIAMLDLTITQIHEGLKKKDFSSTEITKTYLDSIKKTDKNIGAYLAITEKLALAQAGRADEIIKNEKNFGPLTGVPCSIKDVILVEGEKCTAASKILENYVAPYDATVIKKLKKAGTVILGKVNMDEFAMGSSTENSAFKVTKNPHDLTRVPGGTSGGSAASVAANQAVFSLCTDTGGSIRQPASFCGVVGLKTTYGAVSRHGLIAMASSLDQIGPIAKTVDDAALLFKAIAGKDQFDSTSVDAKYGPELTEPKLEDIKKMTIGVPSEYFVEGLDPAVSKAMEEAMAALKSLGIKFKEISLPHTKYALSCYYIIMPAEVSSNLARFDGIRYGVRGEGHGNLLDLYKKSKSHGFGAETKRRIILGTYVLSSGYYDAYYAKAQKVRRLI